VTFSGRAYPLSQVTLLRNGQKLLTKLASADSKFSLSLSNLSEGNYSFGLYAEDAAARRSETFSVSLHLTESASTHVSGIFLSPTLGTDKSQVRRGDNLALFGQTTPNGLVTIEVASQPSQVVQTAADAQGVYLYNLNTAALEFGQYLARSRAALGAESSPFGLPAVFAVGNNSIIPDLSQTCPVKADLNRDCRVNLVDFSIAAFWYKRALGAAFAVLERDHLSGDGLVDLRDFSIMAYHWTG